MSYENFCFLASVSRSCSLLVNSSFAQGVYLDEFIVFGICEQVMLLACYGACAKGFISDSFLFLASVCRPCSLLVKSFFTQGVYIYDRSLFSVRLSRSCSLLVKGSTYYFYTGCKRRKDWPFLASLIRLRSLLVFYTFL